MPIVSLKPLFMKGLGPTQPVADEDHLATLVNWLPSPNGLVPLAGSRLSRGLGIASSEVVNVDGDYVVLRNPSTTKYRVYKYNNNTLLDEETVTTVAGPANIAQLYGMNGTTATRFAFSHNTDASGTTARTKIDNITAPVAPFRYCASFRNRLIYGAYLPEAGVDTALANSMTLLYGANPFAKLAAETIFWGGIDDSWAAGFSDISSYSASSPYLTTLSGSVAGEVFLPMGEYLITGTLVPAVTAKPAGVVSTVRSLGALYLYRVTTEGFFSSSALTFRRVERFPLDVGFQNLSAAPHLLTSCNDECLFVHTGQGLYQMLPVAEMPTFSMKRVANVQSATVVGKCGLGDHLFVDTGKNVHMVNVAGELQTLDYRWLLALHGTVTYWCVFYSHADNAYIVNDYVDTGAASRSTIITPYGAATTDVPIRGCTNSTYYSDALGSASVKTSLMTFETSETKRLRSVRVEASGSLTVTVRMRENSTSAVRTVAYNVLPDPTGVVPIDVSGFSFSVEVTGANTVRLSDVKLDVDVTSKSSYAGARKGLY